jgi:hypothetical protein
MGRLATTLTFGLAILATGGRVGAVTSGAVCRAVCAPRIAEQCAGLTKRTLKACRKPLVRACRQTSPAVACPTSAELLHELADRVVAVPNPADGTARDLTLCATGSFTLRDLRSDGTDAPDVAGQWTVRIADGRLVLALDGPTPTQLPLERAANGDLVVDGLAAFVSGDHGACAPVVAGDDPDARLTDVARKVADRTLATVVVDGTRTTKRELTLCSGGTFSEVVEIDDAGTPGGSTASGTWTLHQNGLTLTLELDDGSGSPRSIPVGTSRGGTIVLDDADTDVRDARGLCEGTPAAPQPPQPLQGSLVDQFTAALRDTAFAFSEPTSFPNIPARVKVGLCGTGRQVLLVFDVRVGTWTVRQDPGAVPVLELADDTGAVLRTFQLTFDAAGTVLLDGQHAPVDEPSIVERACQS